jgi:2'-5' RNA ligase
MDLKTHYRTLWDATKVKFVAGEFGVDRLLFDKNDKRFGVTLLIRPPEDVKHSIAGFLEVIRSIEPNLYYYPESDLHITVMSIISCYIGFDIMQMDLEGHRKNIQTSLAGIEPFKIQMKGITAAPSAIMIQGFPDSNSLHQIRDSLRDNYAHSDLESRMDVRYVISTSHSTVIRFPEKPLNPVEFVDLIETYRDFDFGSFEVTQLEFVYNDWYQRAGFVEKLAMFDLRR